MTALYRKNEILFSILWIVVYVAGTSVFDRLSEQMGILSCLTLPFHLVLTGLALFWMRKNGLFRKYGLCAPALPAGRMLYYLPLIAAASCNLWFGVRLRGTPLEAALYMGSMLCVGFLEEIIFRGFLFCAMKKDGLKSAVIVSSVTFGIGHIVNLVNGSGAELLPNLCQVIYAIAFGFLFVMIFLKSTSLLPCIAAHGVLNALSILAPDRTDGQIILVSLFLTALAAGYAYFLSKARRAGEGNAEKAA